MYAVIGAGAGQEKVAEGQRVNVDLLDAREGDEVTLTAKMVVDGDTVLATPDQLDGVTVTRQPYVEPRMLLDGLGLTGPAWCMVLSVIGDGARAHGRARAARARGPRGQAARLDLPAGRAQRALGEGECPDWRAFHAPRRLSGGRKAVAR